MVSPSSDSSLYQRMVADRSLPLSDYLEMKKPQLLSQSEDARDDALSEIVDTICSLQSDFLSRDQVALLLEFFLGRLESSPTGASFAIKGIHHLVVNSRNLPEAFEKPLVQVMFKDGNVQGWDVEKRLLQYNVLEWLLLHRLQELKSLGPDFVLTFIKTIGGERHPRCLPLVFRMFVIVAQSFQLGPLVEDLFEVVACYFPVEFKQTSDSPITKDVLAKGCLKCLIAHPQFAPFCYLLIDEKFTDDESTPEQKEDTCELLAEAAAVFPPEEIVEHLESLLGGLRVVGLNPKGGLPECVPRALTAMTKALSLVGTNDVNQLGSQLVENLEPFVLQAEMGLTERALSLLRCTADAGAAIRSQIYDRVIPWILMLTQGDVVNVKANRLEIVQEGLKGLMDWTKCIHKHGCDDILTRFQSSLFASLEAARETAPNEALTAMHECAAVYLDIEPVSDEVLKRSENLVKALWNTLMLGSVRNSYLRLITTLAQKNWEIVENIIAEELENAKPHAFPMLCAAVHNEASYKELSENIHIILSENPNRDSFDNFLGMAKRLEEREPRMVSEIVRNFIAVAPRLEKSGDEVNKAYAETLQSLGLLLDVETHLRFTREVVDTITSVHLLKILCLFVIQSQDVQIMEQCLRSQYCDEKCADFLCTGIANHTGDVEKLHLLKKDLKYDVDCACAKGLLLSGKEEGVEMIKGLLERLCEEPEEQKEKLTEQLTELFDFDSAANDPKRSLFKTTFLWKQRIFHQLSSCYVTAVDSADQAGKEALMRLLPALLKSSENISAIQQNFSEFLPVFRVALSSGNEVQSDVLSALPRFIAGLPSTAILPDDGKRIIEAVTRTLMSKSLPMKTLLACLESLGSLAQRTSYEFSNADIDAVVGATTQALAHKKRIVRQKAAAIRNLWETKR